MIVSLIFLSLILNPTITQEHKLSYSSLSLHAMIRGQYRVEHTPSTAYTEYSIHRVQHAPSTAYTEYSIHRVQHTPSAAYTTYCTIPTLTVSHSQPVSYCGRPWCTEFSTVPPVQDNRWMLSHLLSRLPPDLLPPDWSLPSTPPFSTDCGLQVHLQTRSNMDSECTSKLARSQAANVSTDSHEYSLQVRMITAFKFISEYAWSLWRGVSPITLTYSIPVYH